MKVAVSGANGLVGSRILELLKNDFQFIPLYQKDCDITKKDDVNNFFNNYRFDLFLHLAAYTNVDGAEIEKDKAWQINVLGTKNVFQLCQEKKVKLIYISTDFVFDGQNPPYDENSIPNPIGYYGQTKYEGEKIVKDQAMIVRIAYPYRAHFEGKKDFVRSIIEKLNNGKKLTMITDGKMTPTFIDDIAYGLKYLIKNFAPEIFHLVGADSFSPYEAGKLIAKIFDLDLGLIDKISYQEYMQNRARRPQYSEIKSIKNNFYRMKTFEAGLKSLNIKH